MPVCITFDCERDFYSSRVNKQFGYGDKKYLMLERAIPKLLEISDEYDVPYTFFLCGEVAEYCKELFSDLERHAIGVHTHPFTHIDFFRGSDPNDHELDKLERYSYDEQYQMISRDLQLITDNLGVRPKIFRSGKHSTNTDTFKVLDKLDFSIDCSTRPTFQIIGWQPFQINGTSIWEIPTYCDFSPELDSYIRQLFRLSAVMHKFTNGIYAGVIHPMLFGNPIINTIELFDRYRKMIEMMLKWRFDFLTVEQAIQQYPNKNKKRALNMIGRVISSTIAPIHHVTMRLIR